MSKKTDKLLKLARHFERKIASDQGAYVENGENSKMILEFYNEAYDAMEKALDVIKAKRHKEQDFLMNTLMSKILSYKDMLTDIIKQKPMLERCDEGEFLNAMDFLCAKYDAASLDSLTDFARILSFVEDHINDNWSSVIRTHGNELKKIFEIIKPLHKDCLRARGVLKALKNG